MCHFAKVTDTTFEPAMMDGISRHGSGPILNSILNYLCFDCDNAKVTAIGQMINEVIFFLFR